MIQEDITKKLNSEGRIFIGMANIYYPVYILHLCLKKPNNIFYPGSGGAYLLSLPGLFLVLPESVKPTFLFWGDKENPLFHFYALNHA